MTFDVSTVSSDYLQLCPPSMCWTRTTKKTRLSGQRSQTEQLTRRLGACQEPTGALMRYYVVLVFEVLVLLHFRPSHKKLTLRQMSLLYRYRQQQRGAAQKDRLWLLQLFPYKTQVRVTVAVARTECMLSCSCAFSIVVARWQSLQFCTQDACSRGLKHSYLGRPRYCSRSMITKEMVMGS